MGPKATDTGIIKMGKTSALTLQTHSQYILNIINPLTF